jgi:hypothetical protein
MCCESSSLKRDVCNEMQMFGDAGNAFKRMGYFNLPKRIAIPVCGTHAMRPRDTWAMGHVHSG